MFEVKQQILANANIRKLLYYDVATALQQSDVDKELVKGFVFVNPIFDTTIPPYDKNTFITISLSKARLNDETNLLDSVMRVNVFSNHGLWELDNKIRPLEIANYVIDILNHAKLDASHKLELAALELVVLEKNISGYAVLFQLVEGSGTINEF